MPRYIFKKKHTELLTEAIESLKSHDESYDWIPNGSDWGAGGCRVLAEALSRLISDENSYLISTVYSSIQESTSKSPIPQHVFIRCYLSSFEFFIDYNGVQERDVFLSNVSSELNGRKFFIGVYEPVICAQNGINSDESAIQHTYNFLKGYLLSKRA